MEQNNIKETLTFYRKMANTNITIMKMYKSAKINKMNYNDLVHIYTLNNIKFDKDITRLKLFILNSESKSIKIETSVVSEPCEINTETSENTTEPEQIDTETSEILADKSEILADKSEILTNKSEILADKSQITNTSSENIKFYYDNLKKNIYLPIIVPILIPVLILGIIYGRKK